MTALTLCAPRDAAPLRKARAIMDIILHLGAHRTASTSFQHYMRRNAEQLGAQGIAFWDPREVRGGLLSGVVPLPGPIPASRQLERAKGRVALRLTRLRESGMRQLVLSDENLIGPPRRNLRDMRLYPALGERIARYGAVLGGQVRRAVLSVRAQDTYWASLLAFTVARGGGVPGAAELDHMAHSPRSWRGVVTDLACALPGAEIRVIPHESFAGLPERKLALMTGLGKPPMRGAREWLNRAPPADLLREVLTDRGEAAAERIGGPDGRWQPFGDSQRAALREAYADDLFWLRAGAEGLATLTEEPAEAGTGSTPSAAATTRGQTDDNEERRMA